MTEQELLHHAIGAKTRAYAPYSNFPVGAALLAEDGTVFTGCNVENAAYGCCICAEQTAVVKAVSEGHQKFRAIAVVGNSEGPCLPCGTCRQVLSEFAGSDLPVICAGADGAFQGYTLGELLAHSFRLERQATL